VSVQKETHVPPPLVAGLRESRGRDTGSRGIDIAGWPRSGRCRVMGILNVTTDSFSDGGDYLRLERAVARGVALAREGADLIDVGGESTRPGAQRVPAELEKTRVVPVVRQLANAGIRVSVDTMRAEVAEAAVEAGAAMVNDVSGGLADPRMAARVAALGVPYVAMHWRAPSRDMHRFTRYTDVVRDVVAELGRRLEELVAAGLDADRIVVDPGLGFAKTSDQNWEILGRLDELAALGRPVLLGASRKSFLGNVLGRGGVAPPPAERDIATAAVTAIAARAGVHCVRVHDVAANVHSVRVAGAVDRGRRRTRPR
jgi:dihydropteroate synthase